MSRFRLNIDSNSFASSGYNPSWLIVITKPKLEILEKEVSLHPLAAVYAEDIQLAKDIINNELQTVKIVVAEQQGDRNAYTNQNLKFGFGNNNQPTGVVARAGETITVYVVAEL